MNTTGGSLGRRIKLTRVCLVAVFLLVGLQAQAERLRIGFWNIRDLSTSSRDETELTQIARVIKPYDCLAICELNDKEALPALCEILNDLGGEWESVQTSKKSGNTPGSSEYYGFIYRSDKLKTTGNPRILPEKTLDTGGKFDRDPCLGTFATRDGRFDFSMIVVHVTWGSSVPPRKAEIRALQEHYDDVRAADPDEGDVLLCGDFNRNVNDADSLQTLLQTPSMIDTTSATPPTVIKGTSTYDHLLFQTDAVTEYRGTHGVYKFDETMFGGDDAAARVACSDHRPIWAFFNVPEQDDD